MVAAAAIPKNIVIVNCVFDESSRARASPNSPRARGVPVNFDTAAETAIALQTKGPCSAVYHAIDEDDIERIMKSPYTMIASDGDIPVFGKAAPHPRSYGTFARVLGVYVRERHVITLEDAMHKMSGMPAERLKFWRPRIAEARNESGSRGLRSATVTDKALRKPHQYSVGFQEVMVNGKLALHEGAVTKERPGRVIYGPAHKN